MSRAELLEMLIKLKNENDNLNIQLKDAQDRLNDRMIKLSESGSIAEAALKLNGVFEAAERAAAEYLGSIEYSVSNQNELREKAEAETRAVCDKMLAETEARCHEREKQTEARCRAMLRKIKAICEADPRLSELLKRSGRSDGNG